MEIDCVIETPNHNTSINKTPERRQLGTHTTYPVVVESSPIKRKHSNPPEKAFYEPIPKKISNNTSQNTDIHHNIRYSSNDTIPYVANTLNLSFSSLPPVSSNPKNISSRICGKPSTSADDDKINEHLHIKMCSWNVCGCRDKAKRNEIDSVLNERGIAIALLQEANIDASKLNTANYTWYTGSRCSNRRRNLAILISKWYATKVHSIRAEGPHVLCAEISYTTELTPQHMVIVNVHAPNKTSSSHLIRIGTLIDGYPKEQLLLAGDFNSHLAYEDSSQDERQFLGKVSCHDKTNGNGEQLKFFLTRHELSARTMQSNNSLLWTWTNGTKCSQLDHVITPKKCKYFVKALKGRMIHSVSTDHKLVTWSMVPNRNTSIQA